MAENTNHWYDFFGPVNNSRFYQLGGLALIGANDNLLENPRILLLGLLVYGLGVVGQEIKINGIDKNNRELQTRVEDLERRLKHE